MGGVTASVVRDGRFSYLLFFVLIKLHESQVLQNEPVEGNYPVTTSKPLTAVCGEGYGKGLILHPMLLSVRAEAGKAVSCFYSLVLI